MAKKKDKKVSQLTTTEFEIESRREALRFLYKTFYSAINIKKYGNQVQALIEPDTMSDEDWALYIELNWKSKGLINEELN